MRYSICKICLYSVLLVTLVGLFSTLHIDKMSYLGKVNSELVITFYYFVINDISTGLLPGIFAISYVFISFFVLRNNPKQQIIMVINAIVLIIVSSFLGIVIFHNTSWFNSYILLKFIKTIVIIGLLNIMLSFTHYFFKVK